MLPAMIATKNAAPMIQTVTPADVALFVTAASKTNLFKLDCQQVRTQCAKLIQVSVPNSMAESVLSLTSMLSGNTQHEKVQAKWNAVLLGFVVLPCVMLLTTTLPKEVPKIVVSPEASV